MVLKFQRGGRLRLQADGWSVRGLVRKGAWAGWLTLILVHAAPDSAVGHPDREDLLRTYCIGCHSGDSPPAGFNLEGVDSSTPSARPEVWERVVRKLGAGEMPPPGLPRPDAPALEAFRSGLAGDLDAASQRAPYAGRGVIRRLNRSEYANVIRDLLAVDLPIADRLPPDGLAAGFDNIGDALSMSPLLLEGYLKAARLVSETALGVTDPSPVVETYRVNRTQAKWQGRGMPFGTRGGIRVQHHFPYDGEYDLRAFLEKQSLTPREGVRFFRTRVRVEAGGHRVIVTFPDEWAVREGPVSDVSGPGGRALGGPLDLLGTAVRPTIDFRVDGQRVALFEIGGMTFGESAFDGLPGPPTLGRIEIAGPYHSTGVGQTASRERVLVCRPAGGQDETACATRILATVARRAYRRDVSKADLGPLVDTYRVARRQRGFDGAIAVALRDILLSPDFLFRLEFGEGEDPGAPLQSLSGFELASRLSFFLWRSIPDDELLDAAAAGKLGDPTGLEHQVRRMLADQRASTLVDSFAAQWLGLRRLAGHRPDRERFPEFDPSLGAEFREESVLFLRSLFRENRSVLDLLRADYTYLNERLANHYGIRGVVGPGFRRVRLGEGSSRGGLLGHASILMLTSHAARTSPVLRGAWVLDSLLNDPPPPPPANIPALKESADDGRPLSAKEQLARHRADVACTSCHARIDPLGFALENFDAIGRWRSEANDEPVDASGTLAGGETIEGPTGLKDYLLRQPERFVHATVERLLTYALGRELDARDQPTVRGILAATEAGGYRFADLVHAVVRSVPFRMRKSQES